MKRYEAEQAAAAHARTVLRFSNWLWFFVFPVAGTLLFIVFSSGYHAPVHHQPAPFSCASQRADDKVLGDGGAIAPLCGETPYQSAP